MNKKMWLELTSIHLNSACLTLHRGGRQFKIDHIHNYQKVLFELNALSKFIGFGRFYQKGIPMDTDYGLYILLCRFVGVEVSVYVWYPSQERTKEAPHFSWMGSLSDFNTGIEVNFKYL